MEVHRVIRAPLGPINNNRLGSDLGFVTTKKHLFASAQDWPKRIW